jgi:8-amino-7-oxononanoate synthase
MDFSGEDAIARRIQAYAERYAAIKDADLYFYNQPAQEIRGGARVLINGLEMGMYASYSYLGLIGHPRINEAAQKAVEKFGTGTNGVRLLAGTLTLHEQLEETIARFKGTEAAITYTSGYVTNLTVISALLGRGDFVLSDKLNHASIVDGCLMSGAEFRRFKHNDMQDLENRLQQVPEGAARLVIADAVFSMDGDVIDLPRVSELCKRYGAYLMIDEAHSLGVLGRTGHGIEEHFGIRDAIDIKMGTLSKAIPSVGGYVAGRRELINYLRHASRAYIFSAALPPAQTAAAMEAFAVIAAEPWRLQRLNENTRLFIDGLKQAGFDTMLTTTAIVPVLCGSDERAFALTRAGQRRGIFVLPVVSPAVPEGQARLRATITAAHEASEIERAIGILESSGRRLGII